MLPQIIRAVLGAAATALVLVFAWGNLKLYVRSAGSDGAVLGGFAATVAAVALVVWTVWS